MSSANGRSLVLPPSLSSSLSSSLSTTASRHPSHVSKTYRQASTLFLTRRLPEALTTLAPLIAPPGDGEPAPVAAASRTTRIKVWSLYLTVLNAVLEMEPDEGKDAFGNHEWRALCVKVRDGDVWEEVVRRGYHGVEGDIDADVVINLATLLLAHARDQTLNQRRLETYLASSTAPSLDLAGRLAGSLRPGARLRSPAPGTSGANTPRDLTARVKILELYTLHVLLRNSEWDYAREFITLSSVLDDERREAFLQALQSLQDEQREREHQERDERRRQDDQLRRDIDDARRQRADDERRRQEQLRAGAGRERAASDVDYGIEQTPPPPAAAVAPSSSKARPARPPPRASVSRPGGKAVAPPTLAVRAAMVVTRLRAVVDELAASLGGNPSLLTRLLAFTIGLLLMLGHRGIRWRIQRALAAAWSKLKATAGMGTKVSYI